MRRNMRWYWMVTGIALACLVLTSPAHGDDAEERAAQREAFFETIAEDLEPQWKLRVYVLIGVFEPEIREYFENNPGAWANFDKDAAIAHLRNMDWDNVREHLGERNWNDIQERLTRIDERIEEHGWEAVHERLKEIDWDRVRDYLEERR